MIAVFDTETTGLWNNTLTAIDKQPWIVELYAQVLDENLEYKSEFHSYFHPNVKMSKEAAKITGLTDEFLSDKPLFKERSSEIASLFAGCDTIVGHNLTFDLQMLAFDFARCGQKFDVFGKLLFCTMEQNEWHFGFRPNLTLLHETFLAKGFDNSHSAKSDVEATVSCLRHMREIGEF